jgi:hypothetical protein
VSFPKLLLIVGLIALAHQVWTSEQRARVERNALLHANSNGFIDVLMPDAAPPHTVLVFAPVHCPSNDAQRADAMSKELTKMGIPNIRAANYFASSLTRDQIDLINRTYVVLGGAVPTVMIDGKGKANPTVEEVVAEYRRNL